MTNLDQQVKEWASQGLISSDQATGILQYEASKPKSSWILYGLLILGVLITGLGSTLLIWSKWNQISDAVKLLGIFILQVGLSFFAYHAKSSRPKWVYDGAVVALQVSVLLGIAVIADIYKSGGNINHALLFWSLIILPAVLTTHFVIAPLLWVSLLLVALLGAISDLSHHADFFRMFDKLVFFLPPYLAVIFSALGEFTEISQGTKKALKITLFTALLVGIFFVELFRLLEGKGIEQVLFQSIMIGTLAMMTLGVFYRSPNYSKVQKNILMLLVVLYSLSIYAADGKRGVSAIAAVMTIVELGLLGAFFASAKSRKMFNFILILMAIRFFLIFIEAFGGWAMTGMGLVLSGVLLITLTMLWHKYRNQVATWTEKVLQ